MRILHVYKDYYPVRGGIENHIKVLAEAHAGQGHQVSALVCAPGFASKVQELNGVRVIFTGRLMTIASMPISIRHVVRAAIEKADIIHVHSPYPLGEMAAWLLKRGTPLVITHHSDVVRQKGLLRVYDPFQRRVFRHARCIIATSQKYIDTSSTLAPVKETCRVIPLGVDHHRFQPRPARAIPQPTLCFAGKLRYYKGLGTLLDALAELPDVGALVAGTGPMMKAWQDQAERLDLTSRVEFLGDISDDDLVELYHSAHLFVLPANARSEAFGTVLVEAMASGLPCITTEVGSGTSWVVQDGVTGRVVRPGDARALAEAIRDLLDHPDKLDAMKNAARQRVLDYFTEERMIKSVMETYEEVLSSS